MSRALSDARSFQPLILAMSLVGLISKRLFQSRPLELAECQDHAMRKGGRCCWCRNVPADEYMIFVPFDMNDPLMCDFIRDMNILFPFIDIRCIRFMDMFLVMGYILFLYTDSFVAVLF